MDGANLDEVGVLAHALLLERNHEPLQTGLTDSASPAKTIHSQLVDRGPDGKVLFARLLRNNYAEFGSLLQKIRTYTIEK